MHRKILFFIVLCSHSILWASPSEIEFWFFAPDSRQSLLQLIKPMPSYSMAFAQRDLECVPMGDGCFNPQIGYIEDPKQQSKNIGEQSYHTPATLDLNLVECDESYAFDLFCGQAREQAKGEVKRSGQLEIWFDVSTSMRAIFAQGKNCLQLQFLQNLRKKCGETVTVRVFNTRVRFTRSDEEVCDYQGLNNGHELIAQLQIATAKKIVIISDTDEFAGELRTFIEKGNYATQGMGRPIYGPSLMQQEISCSP